MSRNLFIYKHIYHGIGLTYSGGEVRVFCERMKGPHRSTQSVDTAKPHRSTQSVDTAKPHRSTQSVDTIKYLTSILTDLIDRDIAFTYYAPDFIKDDKIYDKQFLAAPWWAFELRTRQSFECHTRPSINNVNPYYIVPNSERPQVKRYLDYIPCIEFEDIPIFCANHAH